ncbi:MAG TPA: threonine--tRNA ligase [Polyangiaceae bacterium]|nr:threonine--tRNA ligase [Polyangiaceae bacterium]
MSNRKTAKELLVDKGQLDDKVVAVRVGKSIVDLHTALDEATVVEPIRIGDPGALDVVRHSTAHVMADAVQRMFPGTKVTIGPCTEDGFYYDFDRPDGAFTDADLKKIEKGMREIVKANAPFRREVVTRAEAIDRFKGLGETYKVEIIEGIPEGEDISLYTHGVKGKEWTDLCAGPHVPSTGLLGAIKLTSVAGAYWRGDERNPMLQRIYGTAFPTQEELDEHLRMLEEAKKRDHRKLGKELDLFMFHEWAPAMPFFYPRGASVYNRMVDFLRGLYVGAGYEEVITPQIYDTRLYQTSGHLANYRENMYFGIPSDSLGEILGSYEEYQKKQGGKALGDKEREEFLTHEIMQARFAGAKPMNCPGHCLMFASRRRSYRDLPWRMADFGRLHRYERGGVVHGLARVRSFAQDDGHIFCMPEQVQEEISRFNKLLYRIYSAFEFKDVHIKLATRPEKRIGTDEMWDLAESALEKALIDAGLAYEITPGEGAFYGPKLEFHVRDALKRSWQLGTIQVDYSMPERFGLEYVGSDGAMHRPVMLHRAILGSVERFMGVYIEHCGGAFPLWIAPEQVILVTVSEKQTQYGQEALAYLRGRGIRAVADLSADKLGAKIRNARMMRYPYLGIIGDREAEGRLIAPRSREAGELEPMALESFADRILAEAVPGGTPPSNP